MTKSPKRSISCATAEYPAVVFLLQAIGVFCLLLLLTAFPATAGEGNPELGQWLAQASDLSTHLREREHAARRILDLGGAALPGLIRGVQSDKSETRQTAAVLLGKLGDADAIDALLSATSQNDFISAEAAERAILLILSTLPDDQFSQLVPEKVNALGATEQLVPFVRCALRAALKRDGDALPECGELLARQTLDYTDASVREAAAGALSKSSRADAAEKLLARVGAEKDWRVLAAVCRSLQKLRPASGGETVEPLATHAEPLLAVEAAGALHAMGYRGMLYGLGQMAHNSTMGARLRAIELLGEIHQPESFDALKACAGDSAWQVQVAAVRVLSTFQDAGFSSLLLELLKSEHATVRAEAAIAMNRMRIMGAVAPMLDDLRGKDPAIRREAARALGEMKAESAVRALRDSVRDPDIELACRAVDALRKIGNKPALEALAYAKDTASAPVADLAARALKP